MEYDLWKATGHGVDDLGDKLPWSTAAAVIKNLSFDSALARDLDEDVGTWNSRMKTNYLLADIFDALININYCLVKMTGGRAQKPKPYPRPKDKRNIKHYGKGALTIDEMRKFVFNKK